MSITQSKNVTFVDSVVLMCMIFVFLAFIFSEKITCEEIEKLMTAKNNPKLASINVFESNPKQNHSTETVYYPIIVDLSKMADPGPKPSVLKKCLEDILGGYDESNIPDSITNDTIYPFYFNYEEFLPLLKESIETNYEILKDLSAQDFIQADGNCNISGIYPMSLAPTDDSENDTRSLILKDIVLQNQLREAIAQLNDSNQFKQLNPPWHVLPRELKSEILRKMQGDPQRYSSGITISVITYYGLLLLVGIPGNGLSILIILTNSYMRTSPNIFLLNIALADFVTLTMGKCLIFRI